MSVRDTCTLLSSLSRARLVLVSYSSSRDRLILGASTAYLGVSDRCCVAGLDFGELLPAGLLSYALALPFVVGADHSIRCLVIVCALCLLLRYPPLLIAFDWACGCAGRLSWSDVASHVPEYM